MASSNQTPDVLFSPIAANADASDINTIPQTYDPTNYGYAAQNVGFPTECRLPVLNPDGTLGQGRAPRMQDWNGIMKLVSSHNFFLQNGGSYTFNPTVSSNIGGYPKNAVLWYFPENEAPCLVYSLINDNTNNFVDDPTLIDGIHWEMLVNPSSYANLALTNSPYTTNRILEIPQDIKFELANNALKLKAGSKLYRPNGFEADGITPHFDSIITENDLTASDSTANTLSGLMITNGTSLLGLLTVDACFSGNTAPTGTGALFWWDTANNIIKLSFNGGSTWDAGGYALSTGIAHRTINVGYDRIEQVFNGFGYIGSTVFALPGVKVQAPNGKNEDGTYKSNILTVDNVKTTTFTSADYQKGQPLIIRPNAAPCVFYANWHFDETTGYIVTDSNDITNAGVICVAGSISADAGKITRLVLPNVDSVANSNASNFSQAGRSYLSGLGMPSGRYIDLTLGASGSTYIAPANGWVSIAKTANSDKSWIVIANSSDTIKFNIATFSGFEIALTIPVHKSESFKIQYSGMRAETNKFCFVYAEGEN